MQPKFTLLIFSLLLISARPAGFKSENKQITQYYVHVPAKDGDHKGFYISSIEITNKQYRDFLNDLRAKGETEKLKQSMVDTAKWKMLPGCNSFVYLYFQAAAYDNFPVVNVSRQGAFNYCEWLTEKYNAAAKEKVHFVLPNEEQWMRAAQGGDASATYPWKGNALTYEKRGKWYKNDMCNYKHTHTPARATNTNNESAELTALSMSYLPNAYGIYNMSGNVAEMIADAGFTKGGSYLSLPDKLTITSREEYAASPDNRPNIGFRPVMLTASGE